MTLEITIRPLQWDDADAVQRYADDERVARTTTIPQPYPENGGAAFVRANIEARQRGEQYAFAILVDGDLIGVVGINAVDKTQGTAQCDYAIAPAYWGQGITTRAVALALTYAFDKLGLHTLSSACLARNPASGRVLQKNGFTETGRYTMEGGKFHGETARRFRLTRTEWSQRKVD